MGQSGEWEHTDTHREGRLPRTSRGLGCAAHPPERSDSPRAAHQSHSWWGGGPWMVTKGPFPEPPAATCEATCGNKRPVTTPCPGVTQERDGLEPENQKRRREIYFCLNRLEQFQMIFIN